MADAWGGSWGRAWGVSWGSTPTPTPTPTPSLQGAGNPAGPGKPHTTGNTYADIVRWTRRGTAVLVKAEAVQTRRPWLHTYAEITQRRPDASVMRALPQLARRAAFNSQAGVLARTQLLRAVGAETQRTFAATAVARQTERQDVADILAIIDMLEDLDGED
jgi:hypothetical protein